MSHSDQGENTFEHAIGETMSRKILAPFILFFISIISVEAHDGLFLKFSPGFGYVNEYSSDDESGFSTPTKNHGLGWGFNDRYAVFIADFGSLIQLNKKSGDYNYINLDAYGLGLTYFTPARINISVAAAYGLVSFAHNWWEATGDDKGDGYAINLNLDKEWVVSKRLCVGLGPQIFFLKTLPPSSYSFLNVSMNFFAVFYFNPII